MDPSGRYIGPDPFARELALAEHGFDRIADALETHALVARADEHLRRPDEDVLKERQDAVGLQQVCVGVENGTHILRREIVQRQSRHHQIELALRAERLHRASKQAGRVAIYTHRNPEMLKQQLAGKRIHRAEDIPLYAIDHRFMAALVAAVERRTRMTFSVTERQLYIDIAGQSIVGTLAEHRLG